MNIDDELLENLIEEPEETEPEQLEPEPEETESEQLEPEPEETEPEQLEPEHLEPEPEVIQSETQAVDYSEHFVILENLGYLQIVFLGTFLSYFVLTLVVKFIKSFF